MILVCGAVLIFSGALGAPFHYDDHALFTPGPAWVEGPLSDLLRPERTRPLAFLSFWLNARLSPAPRGFHLVNLLLHAGCVFLVLRTLRRLLPERAAWLAAGLFAIHPIQTEAVVYVFARPILLATLLCLISFDRWLAGRRWTAAAIYALALLAKEEVAAWPLVVALVEYSRGGDKRGRAPLAAMLALSLAAGLRSLWATSMVAGSGAGAGAGIAPLDYFSAQGIAILRYLWLLIAPIGFTVDADIRPEPAWLAALAWGVIAIVPLLVWPRVKDAREGMWLIGGLLLLLPSSSIFPAADLAADRRMYLPLVAFAAAAGMILRRGRPVLLTLVALTLAALSVMQTRLWQSEQGLWMEAVRMAPDKARPKRQLARHVPPQQALPLLEQARALEPGNLEIATEVGRTLLLLNRPEAALAEFGRVLGRNPGDAAARNNRGVALAALGQMEAAKADFRGALGLDACHFDARLNLARLGERSAPPAGCGWSRRQRAHWEEAR